MKYESSRVRINKRNLILAGNNDICVILEYLFNCTNETIKTETIQGRTSGLIDQKQVFAGETVKSLQLLISNASLNAVSCNSRRTFAACKQINSTGGQRETNRVVQFLPSDPAFEIDLVCSSELV